MVNYQMLHSIKCGLSQECFEICNDIHIHFRGYCNHMPKFGGRFNYGSLMGGKKKDRKNVY